MLDFFLVFRVIHTWWLCDKIVMLVEIHVVNEDGE
jgi:hypothetical protein